jgi:hypothetical protein
MDALPLNRCKPRDHMKNIDYWFTPVLPRPFLGHDAFMKLAKTHD